jgi:hypothetical protein
MGINEDALLDTIWRQHREYVAMRLGWAFYRPADIGWLLERVERDRQRINRLNARLVRIGQILGRDITKDEDDNG